MSEFDLTEFRSRLVSTHSFASLYSSINPIIYSVSRESTMEAPLKPPAKHTGHRTVRTMGYRDLRCQTSHCILVLGEIRMTRVEAQRHKADRSTKTAK
jgi:hypothetical protein